jgi:alpha-methylacyl-CoA racemase
MVLADMGAEVIRVAQKGAKAPLPHQNSAYDVPARGRRSLAIDLKKPGAAAAVLQLIDASDALIEGFRPGVMERLGLGPDLCLQRNPKLVYGRMTGWGQTGPLAQTAGHDLNYISLTGALQAMGRPGVPPPVPLNLIGDYGGGGLLLAFGIVCGLLEARTSGLGQVVDAAMTDGSALLAAVFYGLRAGGSWSTERSANLLDGAAHFYDTYACSDGKYVSVGALEPQFYALLLEKLELRDDPAFEDQHDRARWPALKEHVAAVFKTKTRDQWAELFAGSDACVTPILDWDEALRHPHNRERATFIELAGVTQPAPAPRFSRTPPQVTRPPARSGEHSEGVLADWGVAASDIAELRKVGAI